MIAAARVGAGLAAGVLALLAAAGCSTEYTEGVSAPAARPAQSLEAATTKLRLVQQDACYTSPDVAAQWPRCGRWEEEVLNVANAAAGARPDQREITDPAAAVVAGHGNYARAGCATGGTSAPACVAALTETRTAVTSLASGIGTVR